MTSAEVDALVELVKEWQAASLDSLIVAGNPRVMRATAALLAWSPAPAPVAPPAETFKPPMGVCQWIDDTGDYTTECGHVWQFIDGDVALNDAKFCPFCGGKIQVVDDPPAPAAVAGGDAPPEIQVGDWYQFLDCDVAEVIDERWLPIVRAHLAADELTELRGERHGQPFIWRRRQEGQ